jgi:hypothetical protein
MSDYDDEAELATYVWTHYQHLFTPVEAKAGWAVHADAKAAFGHKDVAEFIWKRHGLADDPAVLAELAEGVEVFRRRAAHRVLREHAQQLFVNRCPRCNRVVRTPKARQCLWCGFDWHSAPTEASGA